METFNDLIQAGKDTLGQILLEEASPVLAAEILKGTVFEGLTHIAGVAVPGMGNLMVSYKQKKLERNFEIYVSKLIENQDEINARLDRLEADKLDIVKMKYFGLVADYASESKQEEKIELMVNGFANIAGGVLDQEDAVLMYYDVLDQLNMLDIRMLRMYMPSYLVDDDNDDNIWKIMEDYNLDNGQQAMIKEKLARLGLLVSRNDLSMDENIRNMAQYLEDISKGKKNPKLKRLNPIKKSDSYRITSYGVKLFQFFTNIIGDFSDTSDLEDDN